MSAAALALGLDATGPAYTDLTYHGAPVGIRSEPQVALVTGHGEYLGYLPHVVKHSPSGISWGYMGSGPADLARSLLMHALGAATNCRTCRGSREVVWTVDGVIPRDPSHADDEWGECIDCDRDGNRPLPYQEFKEQYVAAWAWPEEWQLSRSEVLAWLSIRGITT